MVYLTLDGKEAENFTTKNDTEEYKIEPVLCSYRDNIIRWLESCIQEISIYPSLRETIKQYIHLIKYLTNQTINNDMKNEIVEALISGGESVKAAFEIANSVREAKARLLWKFVKKLEARVYEKDPEVTVEISDSFGNKFQGVHFKLPNKDNEHVMLCFLSEHNYCYLEIVNASNHVQDKQPKNIEYYKNKLNDPTRNWGKVEDTVKGWNGDWVCRYFKMDLHLNDPQFWSDIADDNFDLIVGDVTEDLILLIQSLKTKNF